jgi:site-specific DNA recombinase
MRQHIEARVLGAWRDNLLTPELIKDFIEIFTKELANLERQHAGNEARLKHQLADVARRLEGVLRAVENGAWDDSLRNRLTDLEQRKAALAIELAAAEKAAPRFGCIRTPPEFTRQGSQTLSHLSMPRKSAQRLARRFGH